MSITFSADSKLLIYGTDKGHVKFFNIENKEVTRTKKSVHKRIDDEI